MLCGRTSPRAAVRLATQRRSLVMEATGSPTVLFNLSGALDKAHETKSLKVGGTTQGAGRTAALVAQGHRMDSCSVSALQRRQVLV